MEKMTAKEVRNLITWLKEQGFDESKIVECIESVEENNILDDEVIIDREELDIKRELAHIKDSIIELKFEIMKASSKLKIMDEHIIEEVKKVHGDLDRYNLVKEDIA